MKRTHRDERSNAGLRNGRNGLHRKPLVSAELLAEGASVIDFDNDYYDVSSNAPVSYVLRIAKASHSSKAPSIRKTPSVVSSKTFASHN